MIVMSFDLSSVCIGVCVARIKKDKVTKILSCPIIPKIYTPEDLGYLKSKKKLLTSRGKLVLTYARKGEKTITLEEVKRRNKKVRSEKDIRILGDIGRNIGKLIDAIKPDLILVEKNAIFNGILTSILLAKVMGVLVGLCGEKNIPLEEYSVTTVRKIFNVSKLSMEFAHKKTPEELKRIPDLSKRVLREEMEKIYNIEFQTDDESDACVVFHYWYTKGR